MSTTQKPTILQQLRNWLAEVLVPDVIDRLRDSAWSAKHGAQNAVERATFAEQRLDMLEKRYEVTVALVRVLRDVNRELDEKIGKLMEVQP